MRAVLKKDYEKGGNIPSYEVLKVVTAGGVWETDEMYFYDYAEDTNHPRWEERRYEIAKTAMQGILANNHESDYRCGYKGSVKLPTQAIAEWAVEYADALIAELKKKE